MSAVALASEAPVPMQHPADPRRCRPQGAGQSDTRANRQGQAKIIAPLTAHDCDAPAIRRYRPYFDDDGGTPMWRARPSVGDSDARRPGLFARISRQPFWKLIVWFVLLGYGLPTGVLAT